MAPPIVKRFLISFDQNKWLGFLTFLAALGISGIVAMQPPPPPPKPVYRAVGQLAFREPPPAFTATGSQIQARGRAVSRDLLLSDRVLTNVEQKLQLKRQETLEIRDKNLKITFPGQDQEKKEQSENTPQPQVITLEYADKASPTRAVLILETFIDEMVEDSRWLSTSALRSRIEALSKRLAEAQQELTAAEKNFYDYISKQGSDLLAIQDGSLFSSITNSQQRQRDLQLQLQEVEGQIESRINQLGLTPEQAYTSVALSADPLLANVRVRISQIEQEIERRQLDLRPEHPTMVRLEKERKVSEDLLQQRAKELIGARGLAVIPITQIRQESSLDPRRQQLAAELLGLQTRRAGLYKQLQTVVSTEKELRTQYEKFPDQQLQQARLVQNVEFRRVVYQNILTALVDAQAAEAETVGSLAIALPASYQPIEIRAPQAKNKLLILGAGAGIGLVAGAGVILLLALLDDRLHTPQEIRDALTDREVPLLGQLPYIYNALVHEDGSPVLLDSDAADLSFYERFRSNLRRLGSDISKVIIITSVSNEEGKSTTAYNLAVASALAGKRTLLIEADLRSPSKARWLEVTPNPEANLEPLRYYAARTDAISLVPAIANLYLLPSPGPQRQAAAIVESSELQLLLKDARGRFDLVIVDTPSLSRCNDALLLEPLTDGLVMVTRPGITRSSLLNEAIDQLTEAAITLIGVAINGVENLIPPTSTVIEPTSKEPEKTPAATESETDKVEV